MMKYLLTIAVIICLQSSFAQSRFVRNDLYIEAGGNGTFASVNFERQLTKKPGVAVRAGVGFYTEKKAFYLSIPVGIQYLFPLKKENTFIDAGLGITWVQKEGKLFPKDDALKEENFIDFVPSIGYRKHTAKDVMWRVSFTPAFNKDAFVPWFGVSVGKRF